MRPDVLAISTIAVFLSDNAPQFALTFDPNGPVTFSVIISPPITSIRVSSVPSPPSAIGISIVSQSGITAFTPDSIALAAFMADMLPLKA